MNTPLGSIRVVSDETKLLRIEFIDGAREQCDSSIPLLSFEEELIRYFEGTLKEFTTPFQMTGTPFQNKAWKTLCSIPYGTTLSYKEQAIQAGCPTASRAIALANKANPLAILVPCHRVIRTNGQLSGYAAGAPKKEWLLNHENSYSS